MGTLHKIRVAAVGNEADMLRLNRALLDNGGWLHEPKDRPPYKVQELFEQVQEHARWESGDTFLYSMIGIPTFGKAESGARCEQMQVANDLWVTVFSYSSTEPFQPGDWMRLHLQCDRLPLFVLQADERFSGDKGELIFSNGQMHEDWSRMAESWLWLVDEYEAGLTPEETVTRLKKVQRFLEQEDWAQSVTELLQSCMDNLREIALRGQVTDDMLNACLEHQDYEGFFALESAVADACLWDAPREKKYSAILSECMRAWCEAEGEKDAAAASTETTSTVVTFSENDQEVIETSSTTVFPVEKTVKKEGFAPCYAE